jgi:hypothetical protein
MKNDPSYSLRAPYACHFLARLYRCAQFVAGNGQYASEVILREWQ